VPGRCCRHPILALLLLLWHRLVLARGALPIRLLVIGHRHRLRRLALKHLLLVLSRLSHRNGVAIGLLLRGRRQAEHLALALLRKLPEHAVLRLLLALLLLGLACHLICEAAVFEAVAVLRRMRPLKAELLLLLLLLEVTLALLALLALLAQLALLVLLLWSLLLLKLLLRQLLLLPLLRPASCSTGRHLPKLLHSLAIGRGVVRGLLRRLRLLLGHRQNKRLSGHKRVHARSTITIGRLDAELRGAIRHHYGCPCLPAGCHAGGHLPNHA